MSVSEQKTQPSPTHDYLEVEKDLLMELPTYSKFLMAAVEPGTLAVKYANDSLQRIAPKPLTTLLELFSDWNRFNWEQLYRRHLLPLVLRDVYGIDHGCWEAVEEPAIATLSTQDQELRYIQFWLRSEQLTVERIDPAIDELAEFNVSETLPYEGIKAGWQQKLKLSNYRVKGFWLWEGVDITAQETIQRVITLLLERDSVFRVEKLQQVTEKLKLLFRAQKNLLISFKHEHLRMFTCSGEEVQQSELPSLKTLTESCFFKAVQTEKVIAIGDLSEGCQTEWEENLLKQGIRSLLLIPLLLASESPDPSERLMGIVALTNNTPYNFNQLDINHGFKLLPALRMALRQGVQGQFTHIHPAVEWRFSQEAERRSFGLPPEPIMFKNVYPMYGISDIRGSSSERNQAIQKDLQAQFRLALQIIEIACEKRDIAFLKQLKRDLLAYVERLSQGILVEDEVRAIDYLKENCEAYFDSWQRYGPEVIQAINAYKKAIDNEHHCVYVARDRYDKNIQEINHHLQKTWERWQGHMQEIVSHYCDIELTDGMDHMLYAGSSINKQFSIFNLHSLRYEQLRAMCDCARSCFALDQTLELTHLVLVQDTTLDIVHDERTERLFDIKGSTRDTRYEIVKKRIDKAVDTQTRERITQPGMLTLVYSTEEEWFEYRQYLEYLHREGWVSQKTTSGTVEPLQGVTGLKFARVQILPEEELGN